MNPSDKQIEEWREEFERSHKDRLSMRLDARTKSYYADEETRFTYFGYFAACKKRQEEIEDLKQWKKIAFQLDGAVKENLELRALVESACKIMINDYDDDYVKNVDDFCVKAEKYKQGE